MLKTIIAEIFGTALYIFSVLVYRSCRLRITGEDNVHTVLESGGPIVVTSWHGMTMMVAKFMREYIDTRTFVVIVPDDHDGRTLEVFARHLGADAHPMNLTGDTTLGMGRKLVGLIRIIKSGKNLLIHPDGPAGPAYKIKPGVTFLAQKTGALILPLGCYCRHAYHIPRWDRYTLPLPFSKIHIQTGNPIQISEDLSDLTEINLELTDILHRLSAQASANYYEL